ncbi:MAG TPA: hypothetical protein VMV92_26230 [Streptosporangiaceae bacterium]|nr:hypothetical protein [Streptosporangiaceae bacterium]
MTQSPEDDRRRARPLRCTGPRPDSCSTLPRKRKAHGAPCPSRDAQYELTDEDREWARRTVASLPPLTDRQRDILALLLRKPR